jgi:hypothetical protein
MIDASLQRGRQGWCEEADEPAEQAERGPDIRGAGHSRDHPLQMKEALAVARIGGAGIRERTRGLKRRRQVHGVA